MNGQIPGQVSLAMITTPPWGKCFKTCKHFDAHPEYPPDTFPLTNTKRCTYHMAGEGSSGKEFWLENVDNVTEMYCRKYEERWIWNT